nr:MAG TPA: hypothetical protein [Caudoviricetes sp.]
MGNLWIIQTLKFLRVSCVFFADSLRDFCALSARFSTVNVV